MKKNSKIKEQFASAMKDKIINILLEILKQNKIEIPAPIFEALEKLYGVKTDD